MTTSARLSDGAEGEFLDRAWAIALEVNAAAGAEARSEERDAILRSRCGHDERLLREVEAMLRAEHELAAAGSGFLDRSVADRIAAHEPGTMGLGTPATSARPTVLSNVHVGPWAVEELIGAGGMGAVYRGRRADGAFECEVAIKFINHPDHPRLRERFLHERQILATLDHPNIARLIDGGLAHTPGVPGEGRQPYLVMEYVRGRSIIQHCDEERLTIDQRLEMFETICDAVQYAHANLIVHRDLKPANILVNDHGEPKLLDFGIAKPLDDSAFAPSSTVTADRRCTPQYAAPEQLLGRPITVAADVYALGLILYELLAGVPPYRISGDSPVDEHRVICETMPPPPSRRLGRTDRTAAPGDSGDLTGIAQARRTDVARLRRQLRSDLDHIVMAALRKEPSRRYPSVEALREDVRRYRSGLPISARPDSLGYRATRFVQRHRASMVAAAVAAFVLVAASIVSSALALRLSERTAALDLALGERSLALDEAQARQADAVREYHRMLSSSSTLINTLAATAAADESARQRIIDDIRARIERIDAMTIPLAAEAEIASRQALAMLARTIEAFDLAMEQNQRVLALTADRPEEQAARAEAFAQIGWLHVQQGEAAEAILALQRAAAERDTVKFTVTDLHLMEAFLMLGDAERARDTLRQQTFPSGLATTTLRNAVVNMEQRFGVSLLE